MRFIIYGAGAIGGTIGARLFQHGKEVILIARGAHLDAMRERGPVFKTPKETVTLSIPCAGEPSEIEFRQDDVVFMTMKGQHTLQALEALRASAGENMPVICCQNGVANERMALRRFDRVYGMVVMLPASHLEPGVVRAESKASTGILDAGCFPSGVDGLIEKVTAILSDSGFSSQPDPNIMRWKYAKLLMNLNNSIQALCEPKGDEARDIMRMMAREALACYEAAQIDCAGREEFTKRRGDHIQLGKIEGSSRGGGSSWQSIARGTGSIEADYLNGEIVLLGKLHGVDTPANRVMQQMANRLARDGGKPGSYSVDQIRTAVAEAGGKF